MVPAVVLLDAMGTLVRLQCPWPNLVRSLGRRGVTIEESLARSAMLAEIAYYREHHDEGGTDAGLAKLRDECAAVLGAALGDSVTARLTAGDVRAAMLEAIVFDVYPEVPAVLAELRDRGARLVVVSNWDRSLLEVLDRTGLTPLLDGVVISAQEGVAKPDRRIFARALQVAGVPADCAIHVGDSVTADVEGALAAGIGAVFVDRDGSPPRRVAGAKVIGDLTGLL